MKTQLKNHMENINRIGSINHVIRLLVTGHEPAEGFHFQRRGSEVLFKFPEGHSVEVTFRSKGDGIFPITDGPCSNPSSFEHLIKEGVLSFPFSKFTRRTHKIKSVKKSSR